MDMNIQFAKVLDKGLQHDANLKRKRAARHEIYSTGTRQISLPLRATPSICSPAKRRKFDGCKGMFRSSDFPSGKRLLKYYSNLKKSGPPHRLMFYHNDEWCDFPQDVVTCLKNDFLVKKTTIEVDVKGDKNLLDFLHMTKLDLNTGLCQPIAWIDISGKCFFPEIVSDCDEAHGCSYEFDKDEDHVAFEPVGFEDINLHLELEISGIDAFKFKESSGESSAVSDQVHTYGNSSGGDAEDEVSDIFAKGRTPQPDQKSGMILKMEGTMDSDKGHMKYEAVKELLLRGIRSYGQTTIVDVRSCSGIAIEARYELFQKQVEITERFRGNANVLYAWLPCPKGTVSSILNYGVGFYGSSMVDSVHGLGVHLIPAYGAEIRSNFFSQLSQCYRFR